MGKPKFSLTYDGISGTEKAVKLLSKFCNKVFLSSRADLDMGSLTKINNVERINDEHINMGPVGGLATLMGQFPNKAWMITACDMPFLKEDDFENKEGKYQLEVRLEDQKLIPEIQQNLQAGIYNEGPLSKKYETGVGFFHDLYLNKLNLEKTK